MNIGIVTTWFERGAAYVSRQFMDLLVKDHQVFIYARGGEKYAKDDPKWDLPNVYWSKNGIQNTYINKNEFKKWLLKNNIEAVLFNEQQYFTPLIWCKEWGIPSIAYVDYYTEESIPLFGIYDSIVCNTQRHCSAFDVFNNVHYLPWGTDNDIYKPVNEDGRLVDEENVVFFNSAGMNPLRKGTDTFIKALYKCKDQKNIKALIHSQVSLKNFFPNLAGVISELEEKGMLDVIEKTIPAPGLYYRADVYVYPSILDGIGLTVPEAISSGLACIASDNPPMNEFVHEDFGSLIPIDRLYARKDGYYWPQCRCDVDALADILRDYAMNPLKVVDMKKKARQYALKKLSFEKNASSITEIIENTKLRKVDDSLKSKIVLFDRSSSLRYYYFMLDYNLYKPYNAIRKLLR